MEDKSDNKSRRDKRAEEDRKAKDRARASGGRDRDRNRGDRDRNRDRDREAKSRARHSGSSAVTPGAVAERKRDDDRVSRKTSSSGSSRTRDSPRTPRSDRDEKSKERSRRTGYSGQAVPGAVAEKNVQDANTPMSPRESARRRKEKQKDSPTSPMMSPRERARRRKEKEASGSAPSVGSSSGRDSGTSRRERSRREKEKQASMNAVPAPQKDGAGEEVPTAAAIDDDAETMEFEATAVSNITQDQLEAARQQGREEARNEQHKHRESQRGDDDDSVLEAGPAQKNNKAKKYAFAAFVIVAIIAGIVVWRVMFTGKSDPTQEPVGPTVFKPPTEDDCFAVSKGLAVAGQSEASIRTYAVEMNLAVTPGMDLAALKSELEILTQRNVLPLLIGCGGEDGPIIIQNNNFVITNAKLESVTMDSPKSCSLGAQSLCAMTNMEMDLFLKDPEVSSDYILELIAFVFEHKGLLEVLELLTPIESVDTQRRYEVLATAEPTSAPNTPAPTPAPTTTLSPTRSPTKSPTKSPTPVPTTKSPTKAPTTPFPTKSPTKSPTPRPTLATPNPTASPTRTCIQSNLDLVNAAAVYAPTPSPVAITGAVIAQYGTIEDWCFGPAV